MRLFVSTQRTVGEILPHDPDGSEQGRHWPYDIHDPHVLRMSSHIDPHDDGVPRASDAIERTWIPKESSNAFALIEANL
jgi:hypothetical protein